MSRNVGKRFEDNIKDSCPEWLWVYRPPDAAQSFNRRKYPDDKLRFSNRSPADFFMYNGKILFVMECKSFQGSCSFERSENEKGKIIHWYQIERLFEYSTYKNIIAGFLLDFRKTDHTYFLSIQDFLVLKDSIEKKSFNEEDMLKYCSPTLIEKEKLRVNYRYDIGNLLDVLENS